MYLYTYIYDYINNKLICYYSKRFTYMYYELKCSYRTSLFCLCTGPF